MSALSDPAVRDRLRTQIITQGLSAMRQELARMTQELQAKQQEISAANSFRQTAVQYPRDVSGVPWSDDMFARAARDRDQLTADLQDAETYAADVEGRLDHFKHVVCLAAALRLDGNEQALAQWQTYVDTELTPDQVLRQAQAEQERSLINNAVANPSGGQGMQALERRTHSNNRYAREVEQRAATGQIGGGCEYCHEMKGAIERFHQDPLNHNAPDLLSQFEDHLAAEHTSPSPLPAPGLTSAQGIDSSLQSMSDARLQAFPGLQREASIIARLRPFVRQLGDDGFKVLPNDVIDTMAGATPEQVADRIRELILVRRNNFLVLAQKCRTPDADYLLPRPVLRELMATADQDVQGCVRAEIAQAQSDAEAEAVIVGAASILALLLTVFPPTAPIGLAMDVGLAGYGIVSGYAAFEQGQTLSLGLGSTVLDPDQQEAANSLVVMGAVTMVLSAISLVGTGVQSVRILRAGSGPGAIAEGAEVEAGSYRISVTDLNTSSPTARVISADGEVVAQGPLESLEGPAVRTPNNEYADFLAMLEQEGAVGPLSVGDPAALQPHALASEARAALNLPGTQSAHGLPQSVGRGIPGYNPRAAVTTLESQIMHTGMDQYWKDAFQAMRRQGRTTASAQEIFDVLAESIRRSAQSPEMQQTLISRLQDEMFVELGLQSGQQFPLPYANIHP